MGLLHKEEKVMTTKHVGNYVITVELDRVDGGLKYYDAVLSKDDKEVKIYKGCIGEKSGEFWALKLEDLATKLGILDSRKEMVVHNLLCYSSSYLMNCPKDGMEEQWHEAKRELVFITRWVNLLCNGRD